MSSATLERTEMQPPPQLPPARKRGALAKLWLWMRNHLIQFLAGCALVFMFLPVAIVLLFSFNEPVGRFNYTWNEFSPDAWIDVWQDPQIVDPVILSLTIGFIAALVATILGTLIAFAIGRHRFKGRGATNLLIFMPMATPEVVMGASLLALFINMGLDGSLGVLTITIAHIMFCISFVVVTVKARIAGLDSRLEQSAMDLYADERTTFRKVTFPLVLPGIVAGALLAFSLSFDDFIITNFTAGSTITFPVYVWGAAGKGIPPEANVIGSAMFLVALVIVLAPEVTRRRSKTA